MNFYVAFHLTEQREIKNVCACAWLTPRGAHKITFADPAKLAMAKRHPPWHGANISMRVYAFV